jgi:hypothetical protein
MCTQPNNNKKAHSIPKAQTERRKESLPYMLGVASFRWRGGTKLKQLPPVLQAPGIAMPELGWAKWMLTSGIRARSKI